MSEVTPIHGRKVQIARTMDDLRPDEVRQLAQRFWTHVQSGAGCWLWLGHTNVQGYGYFRAAGRQWVAHRVSYFLSHGYEARPLVRHLCDEKGCVHPGHLVRGTVQENADDEKLRRLGLDLVELHRGGEL